jgi:hypothetical protein
VLVALAPNAAAAQPGRKLGPIPPAFCATWHRHGAIITIACAPADAPDELKTQAQAFAQWRVDRFCGDLATGRSNPPPCDQQLEGGEVIARDGQFLGRPGRGQVLRRSRLL